MDGDWMLLFKAAWALLLLWGAWIMRRVTGDIKEISGDLDDFEKEHNKLALNVSENYAKKNDLNAARQETTESIRRLHEKIEESTENLNEKISEVPEKIMRLLERGK